MAVCDVTSSSIYQQAAGFRSSRGQTPVLRSSRGEPADPEQTLVVFFAGERPTKLGTGMSVTEAAPRCRLRALAESVSEQLRRVGDEVLGLLEKRSCRSGSSGGRLLQLLRLVLTERLAAAAERIVELLEREVEEYRRQLERQSRLLEAVLNPVVRLKRTGETSPSNMNQVLKRVRHSQRVLDLQLLSALIT